MFAGSMGGLPYPLLSDFHPRGQMAQAYGVWNPDLGTSRRAVIIIDKEGVIQHSTINNLSFGRSVDETLRVLQALQHVQNNPDEVCPAGWTPGAATMKPTPKDSKDYFSAL